MVCASEPAVALPCREPRLMYLQHSMCYQPGLIVSSYPTWLQKGFLPHSWEIDRVAAGHRRQLHRAWKARSSWAGIGKWSLQSRVLGRRIVSREAAYAGVVVSRVRIGHPWGARATLRGRRLAGGPLCQLQPAQASPSVTRRQQCVHAEAGGLPALLAHEKMCGTLRVYFQQMQLALTSVIAML